MRGRIENPKGCVFRYGMDQPVTIRYRHGPSIWMVLMVMG